MFRRKEGQTEGLHHSRIILPGGKISPLGAKLKTGFRVSKVAHRISIRKNIPPKNSPTCFYRQALGHPFYKDTLQL
jgi:hypothetical protein